MGLPRTVMNRWRIPAWLEIEVIDRDRRCIYCHVEFAAAGTPRGKRASWEHIVNDARIVTRESGSADNWPDMGIAREFSVVTASSIPRAPQSASMETISP